MDQLSQATAVVFVLALLGGALYLLRSRGLARISLNGLGTGARQLQSIEKLSLTAQHSLHLVRIPGRVLLIAVSPNGCSVLDGGDSAELERIRPV